MNHTKEKNNRNKIISNENASFKKKSIKTMLIIVISLSCALIMALIIGYVTITERKYTLDRSYEMAQKEASVTAKEMEASLNSVMDLVRTIAVTFEATKESKHADRDQMNAILQSQLKSNKNILGLWTVWEPNALDGNDNYYKNTTGTDDTGRFISYWHWDENESDVILEALMDYDKEGAGDYYLLAKDSGQEVILEPFSYVVNGKDTYLTSLVVPIIIDNEVLGVVGADITLTTLQQLNASNKYYDSGYSFFLTDQGLYIAHKNNELIGTNIFDSNLSDMDHIKTSIKQKISFQSDKISNTKGTKDYVAFEPIKVGYANNCWYLASVFPLNEITREIDALVLKISIISFIGILFLIVIVYQISGRFVNPIKILSKEIDSLAKYDLSYQNLSEKYRNRKDELGVIAMSLHEMKNNFTDLIHKIGNGSENLAAASEETSSVTTELSNSVQSQVQAMKDVIGSTNEMALAINDVAKSSNTLAELINVITDNSSLVKDKMNDTIQISSQGQEKMTSLVHEMNHIKSSFEALSDSVNKTGASVSEIRGILVLINSLAEQTNLLSLNAAIESSRAGDAGKGFAVVADEIRKLAEGSAQATQTIGNMINAVEDKINQTVQNSKKNTEIIEKEAMAVLATSDSFQNIFEAVNSTSGLISQILINVEDINSLSKNVAAATQQQTAASQEILATSEMVGVMNEQVGTGIEEVANTAEQLAINASQLRELVIRFKLD